MTKQEQQKKTNTSLSLSFQRHGSRPIMFIHQKRIEIAEEKLVDYLLEKKDKNDKSAFLRKLGYTKENWKELQNDILNMVESNPATLQQNTDFGDMYEVKGELKHFGIVSIWLLSLDKEKFRFITLFPNNA